MFCFKVCTLLDQSLSNQCYKENSGVLPSILPSLAISTKLKKKSCSTQVHLTQQRVWQKHWWEATFNGTESAIALKTGVDENQRHRRSTSLNVIMTVFLTPNPSKFAHTLKKTPGRRLWSKSCTESFSRLWFLHVSPPNKRERRECTQLDGTVPNQFYDAISAFCLMLLRH